jgi:Tfp pilus assembly protein PilF
MGSKSTAPIIAAIGDGDYHRAERLCRTLSRHDPAEAAYLLAVVRRGQGRLDDALDLFRQAAEIRPDRADIAYNFGTVLRETGRSDQAMAQWRRTLILAPGHRDAMYNLALALSEQGQVAEATPLYAALVVADPGHREARFNLGNLFFRTGDFDRAARTFATLMAQEPDAVRGLVNYGMALKALGRDDEAEASYRRAIAGQPRSVLAHWNLAVLLLSQGRWREGFEEFEWRLGLPGVPRPDWGVPLWRGDEPPGTRVLVWNDHGCGDAIQFFRYLSGLVERGQRVFVHAQDSLKRLAATMPGVERVVGPSDPRPECGAHVPLLSLPRLLGRTDPQASWPGAYLRAEASLTLVRRPAIGLTWAGNQAHGNDSHRSLPLAVLTPLLAIDGIQWVNLQVGPAAAQVEPSPWAERMLSPPLTDFADTAAVIRSLDLVISVDTAVAHLAGALDVPAWVLIPAVATDWRWGKSGETTPWYPSMRLFRQPAADAWTPVIARIAGELSRLSVG